MTVQALFFGAIGTLAETSDLQRTAFNLAFAEAGLDWVWRRDAYIEMLASPGGRDRVAAYAEKTGADVDAGAIHHAKTRYFAWLLRSAEIEARPGAKDLLAAARDRGIKCAFVTGTEPSQIDAILQATGLSRDHFDWISDRSTADKGKPAPDLYLRALEEIALDAARVLAIEDTPESAEAAVAAGIRTIGFAGAAAEERAFPEGVVQLSDLTPDLLDADRDPIARAG